MVFLVRANSLQQLSQEKSIIRLLLVLTLNELLYRVICSLLKDDDAFTAFYCKVILNYICYLLRTL